MKFMRERVIGKLRALNLNIDAYTTKDGTKMFVRISAPNTILQYEAEQQLVRLRLREEFGGALCAFSQELDEKNAFDKPLDGFELFSSANQLSMIKEVVYSEPYDDGVAQDDEPIDFDTLIQDEVAIAYFPLHHDRMRLKLLNEWARTFGKPQPLEMVREYFGEKIALFYTWYGYYITMLFIPGLVGIALVVSQFYYYPESQWLENPYTPIFAIIMSVWASMFTQLWQSLETTRKYEWDTLEFENQESVREEFKESGDTLKDEHIDEVTDEVVDYYFDEGSYLPPTGRARKQLLTYLVILAINIAVVVAFVFIWTTISLPMMEPGNVLVGSIVSGVLNSVITILVDATMDGIAELELVGAMHHLIMQENWRTATEHEDALIMKTFYFKFAAKYFALFMVAFGVNNVQLLGEDARCPEWDCLPVLQIMVCTIVVVDILYSLVVQNVFPAINKYFDGLADNAALKARAGMKIQLTPQEEQYDWLDPTPVVDLYKDKIYQFGYIAMFGSVFPLIVPLCLLQNLVEIRARAAALLTKNRRPEPAVAADIGPYQSVLEIISTLSIITNSAMIGITGYGFYFYFPDMNPVDCLWVTVVLEHALLLIKILIINLFPSDPADAKLAWTTAQERKKQQLAKWNMVERTLDNIQ